MKKVLITYATRPLGLRVARLLSPTLEVEKASSDEIPSVLKHAYARIPRGGDPTCAHELLKLALDKGCNYLLPLGLDEIKTLSETAVLFEEYGIEILCPPNDVLSEVNVWTAPEHNIQLCLLKDKKDMLTGKFFEFAEWDGLCVVSDSEDEFVLVVV